MKTYLVTGAAGFIGSEFVRQLIAETNAHVIALDLLTYAGNVENLDPVANDPRFTFVKGNIGDRKLVDHLFEKYQFTSVVNFAAETHVDRSIGQPSDFVRTNVVGTFELLDASLHFWKGLSDEQKQAFRFLHVSTDEVYGTLGDEGKFLETTPYSPNSPYSASKASSDHFVRAYHHTYGLPTLITNCSNNYGPYQFPEKLIPLMIRKALAAEKLPVYGKGDNVRDWLHVGDHCRALRAAIERGGVGETYNIGGDAERSNIEVVTIICQKIDELCPELRHRPCSQLIRYVTDRPGHDFRYAIDFSKIESELGWRPQVSFEEGIEQTIRWYIDNTDWVQRALSQANYSCERLGLAQNGDAPTNGRQEVFEPIEGVEYKSIKAHEDGRGWLMELYRNDELPTELEPKMAYISQTLPGIARGPHEHVEQTDYFAFIGPGDFCLYLWDAREDSPTCGNRWVRVMGESNPMAVAIPPGVVHAYRNISDFPGTVFNAPNQLYAGEGRQGPVDEIRHEDAVDTRFVMS